MKGQDLLSHVPTYTWRNPDPEVNEKNRVTAQDQNRWTAESSFGNHLISFASPRVRVVTDGT
ncbi:hypothetical protein CRG98_003186, partial [Punica granatum]